MGGILSGDYGTIHATDYRGNSYAVNGTVCIYAQTVDTSSVFPTPVWPRNRLDWTGIEFCVHSEVCNYKNQF